MTRYFWDPVEDNVIEEYDENGAALATYTSEAGLYEDLISQHRGGATSVYHYDGQGNTTALTDENGNVTDTYDYNAFGEITEQTGTTENSHRYVGEKGYQYNKETSDCYIRERVYEPAIARWLSADPLEFSDGPCVYCYVSKPHRGFGSTERPAQGSRPGATGVRPVAQLCSQQTFAGFDRHDLGDRLPSAGVAPR